MKVFHIKAGNLCKAKEDALLFLATRTMRSTEQNVFFRWSSFTRECVIKNSLAPWCAACSLYLLSFFFNCTNNWPVLILQRWLQGSGCMSMLLLRFKLQSVTVYFLKKVPHANRNFIQIGIHIIFHISFLKKETDNNNKHNK